MKRLLLAALLATATLQASALEIAGVNLEDTTKVGSADLVLNGAGVRKKAFFKVYAAGLYLAAKSAGADGIIGGKTPRRMTLTMLRDVDAPDMHEALVNGLKDNHSKAELDALAPKIKQLESIMAAVKKVKEKDVIAFDFLPGQGTRITVRGQVKDVIAGDDMAQALLRIWLGKEPVQDDLKTKLLGKG